MLDVKEEELKEKYASDDINLLTNFELFAQADSIVIETAQAEGKKKEKAALTEK